MTFTMNEYTNMNHDFAGCYHKDDHLKNHFYNALFN